MNENNNAIGQALKTLRQYWGMTQKQWAAGIISPAYYSKVESGKAEISAKALFQLIEVHDLSMKVFISLVSTGTGSPIENIKEEILLAQNTGKLIEINKIAQKIKEMNSLGRANRELIDLFIKGAKAWVAGTNKDISEEDKKMARALILKSDWDRSSFLSLAILISLFDINEAYLLIMSAINYYTKYNKVPGEAKLMQAILSYLNYFCRNGVKKQYVETPIKFMRKLAKRGYASMGYNILCTYYEALVDKDYEKAKIIAGYLKDSNCFWAIANTMKKDEFINE